MTNEEAAEIISEIVPSTPIHRHTMEALRMAEAALRAQGEPVAGRRLYSPYGRWHHGNGVLCAGTLRIAREDFDTNPADKVKKDIFDWTCATLNTTPHPQGEEHGG